MVAVESSESGLSATITFIAFGTMAIDVIVSCCSSNILVAAIAIEAIVTSVSGLLVLVRVTKFCARAIDDRVSICSVAFSTYARATGAIDTSVSGCSVNEAADTIGINTTAAATSGKSVFANVQSTGFTKTIEEANVSAIPLSVAIQAMGFSTTPVDTSVSGCSATILVYATGIVAIDTSVSG